MPPVAPRAFEETPAVLVLRNKAAVVRHLTFHLIAGQDLSHRGNFTNWSCFHSVYIRCQLFAATASFSHLDTLPNPRYQFRFLPTTEDEVDGAST